MSINITVDSLAKRYAFGQVAQQAAQKVDPLLQKRVEYNFKAAGFNCATIATIGSLAMAIFSSSMIGLMVGAIFYNTRISFLRAVQCTGLFSPEAGEQISGELIDRIMDINPAQRNKEIAIYLKIEEPTWDVFRCRIFDFKLWMNSCPIHQSSSPSAPLSGRGVSLNGQIKF